MAIVLINKQLLVLRFSATLTVVHMIVTAAWLFFTAPKAAIPSHLRPRVAIIALLNGLSIPFANLMLQLNSQGSYYMGKLLFIPTTVTWQLLLFGESTSLREAGALVTLLTGVGIATVTDLELSAGGAFAILVCVLSTTFVHVQTSRLQRAHNIHNQALMRIIYPISVLGALPLIPLQDDVGGIAQQLQRATTGELAVGQHALFVSGVLASCALAVVINWSTPFIVASASPIMYQVLGCFKTAAGLTVGVWLFDQALPPLRIAGLALAYAGMVLHRIATARPQMPKRGVAAAKTE